MRRSCAQSAHVAPCNLPSRQHSVARHRCGHDVPVCTRRRRGPVQTSAAASGSGAAPDGGVSSGAHTSAVPSADSTGRMPPPSASELKAMVTGGNKLTRALSAVPLALIAALSAALSFLRACVGVLPEMVVLPPGQAFKRLGLVLGASLVMVVIVTNIDAAWLHVFVLRARRVA